MKRGLMAVGVAAAMVVGLGACGDDEEERLSKADFLEQGNAVCAEGNQKADEAFGSMLPEDGSEPSMEDIIEVMNDTIIPGVQEQIDGIRALSPPEDLEDDVNKMLDDAEAALDEVETGFAEDPESFFETTEDPFADVNAQAAAIGLTECDTSDE